MANFQSIAKRFVVYLEGIKIPFSRGSVSCGIGMISSASISIPFSPSIRRIRAKTVCQIFFIDFKNEMRLMFEGELSSKQYVVASNSASVSLGFTGIAGNFNATTVALVRTETPSAIGGTSGTFSGLYLPFAAGESGGTAQQVKSDGDVGTTAYAQRLNPVNDILLYQAFESARVSGANGSASVDFVKAFQNMFKNYINPPSSNAAGLFKAGSTSAFFSIADQRFKLISGITGVTSKKLASLFFRDTPESIRQFLDGVSFEVQGQDTVLNMTESVANKAFHFVTDFLCPPKLESGIISRLMVVPDLKYADPPICNVFLPPLVNKIFYGINVIKPTRLIYAQENPLTDTGSNDLIIIGALPAEVSLAMFPKGTDKNISLNAHLTQEEAEVGVIPMVTSGVYPPTANVDTNSIREWLENSSPLRFIAGRTDRQTASISMDFYPYVSQGFPGAFIDPIIGTGRGMVASVTHSFDEKSGATGVKMSGCFFAEDDAEVKMDELDPDSGFGNKLNIYLPGNFPSSRDENISSDVYEFIIGVKSLTANSATKSESVAESLKKALALITIDDSSLSIIPAATLVQREIATYQDLAKFYDGGTVRDYDINNGPDFLDFKGPFVFSQNAGKSFNVTKTNVAPTASPVASGGSFLGPQNAFQESIIVNKPLTEDSTIEFLDRRTPVEVYVNDVSLGKIRNAK